MPSFTKDENNVVNGVMSFDPVSPEQLFLADFDCSIVGKYHKDGAFYDVETHQVDSTISTDSGDSSDE